MERGTSFTLDPVTGQRNGIVSPVWEEQWNFDPTGNWHGASTGYLTKANGSTTLNQNRAHNVANEITDITESTGTAWPTPVQNAVGNMTSLPQPLSLGNAFDLKWDAWNRVVEVRGTGNSFVARYAYDGANRRVSKLTGAEFRHFYYSDQWQILEERTGTNNHADRRFVWGMRHIDDLICRDRRQGGKTERLYVLHDALNVTASMDVNGLVLERYGYDAFGTPRYMDASFGNRSSSNYDWETLYAAYRYDKETGFYQVRNRYLHPKLGRWTQRDPIEEGGGINLFTYVANNAINAIDWDGLQKGGELLVRRRGAGRFNPITGVRRLVGLPFSVLSGDIFDRSRINTDLQTDKCRFTITINGIWNRPIDAKYIRLRVGASPRFQDSETISVRNETHFFRIGDLFQILGHEVGAIDVTSVRAAKQITRAAEALRRKGCQCTAGSIQVVAHSQGTMIFNRALPLLDADVKQLIRYVGIGGEKLITFNSGLASVENFANFNSFWKRDWVPVLGNWINPLRLLDLPQQIYGYPLEFRESPTPNWMEHGFEAHYQNLIENLPP